MIPRTESQAGLRGSRSAGLVLGIALIATVGFAALGLGQGEQAGPSLQVPAAPASVVTWDPQVGSSGIKATASDRPPS